MALTAKQRSYVEGRISCLDPVEAYRAAYSTQKMSPPAIRVEAYRLEKHPAVALQVTSAQQRIIQRVEKRTAVTVSRVVEEYARIAFADMRRYASVTPGGVRLRDSTDWTDDDAAAVAELGQSTSKDGGSIRFKLHNKVAALDSLAKHLGMFGDDPTRQGDRHLHLHGLTDEQLRTLASGLGS